MKSLAVNHASFAYRQPVVVSPQVRKNADERAQIQGIAVLLQHGRLRMQFYVELGEFSEALVLVGCGWNRRDDLAPIRNFLVAGEGRVDVRVVLQRRLRRIFFYFHREIVIPNPYCEIAAPTMVADLRI